MHILPLPSHSVRNDMRLWSFSVKVSKIAIWSINETFSYWADLSSTATDFCPLFCHVDLELSISYWLQNRKSIICILLRVCENWIYLHIHWHFTMKFWACNKAVSSYSGLEKFMIMTEFFLMQLIYKLIAIKNNPALNIYKSVYVVCLLQ